LILNGRPGASGPWQVEGRSFINFDKRVKMDANYIKRRSIFYDVWIILKTPIAMITGKGAI
jgi:lipopolysaccharide/colanic/teichoic acid biosynthesis glycosyltransferase